MKRILTLLFSLAMLVSFSQTPIITAYVSGHVSLAGTNLPVADHMVKVTLYSLDSINGSYFHEDLYTTSNGYYAFQGSVVGTQGFLEVQTQICDNQIQTEVFDVTTNGNNTFTQDFYVCDSPGCNADFTWYQNGYLNYQFQNLSTGDSLLYSWSFGDGTFSNEENPFKIYQSPGMYEVTLAISSPDPAGCSSTLTQVLWAGNDTLGCQASFRYVQDSMNGTTVYFYDMSFGSFTSWYWDFGDGTYSTEQNPVHTYEYQGAYNVCLTVSMGNSCSDTYCEVIYIGQNSQCQAWFSWYPMDQLTYQFLNESVGTNLSYNWYFGDGSYSNEENPVKTFPVAGMYEVTLSIQSNQPDSCFSTITNWVWVGDTIAMCQAYFYAVPDSAGGLTASFYDMSSGSMDSWLWDFGDGTLSNEQNPVHTYQQAGIYEVCLTITNNSNLCWDMYCETVFIGQNSQCLAQFAWYPYEPVNPTEIQFVDLSYGEITNWEWSFGDGTGSNEQNPLHVYGSTGTYDVCLTVYGPDCQSSWCETVYVEIYPDCANYFTYNLAGMDVEFYGNTLANTPAEFYWEFGDGISATGNPVTHTYPAPGIYYVTLTTVDLQQCVATSYQEVVVGDTIWYNQIYGQVFENDWPLTNGMVMIFSDYSDTNFYYPYYEMTTVDQTGVFVFPMVPYGNYKIMAIPTDGSTYLPTYYESTVFWQDATTIIAGTTPNPVNIYLQNVQGNSSMGTGTISGHITQSLRSGFIGQIVVYLTDSDYQIIGFTQVDDNGDFAFNNLANGTYYIKPELSGIYSEYHMVILSNSNNQINVNLTFNGNSILGKDEGISLNANVSLHPNPASETVRVTFTQQNRGNVEITLYDLSGRSLMNQSCQAGSGMTSTDLKVNLLEPGIYLLKLKFEDGSSVSEKMVKN